MFSRSASESSSDRRSCGDNLQLRGSPYDVVVGDYMT